MKTFKYIISFTLVFMWPAIVFGQDDAEKKGLEIMLKYYEQMTTRNWRSDVVMRLVGRSGNTQNRHLKRLSKTDDQNQEKYHLRFLKPPRIRNTTLLMVEHLDREDDIWVYFPAIKKTQRISGTNLRASYMGTLFSYKDLKRVFNSLGCFKVIFTFNCFNNLYDTE